MTLAASQRCADGHDPLAHASQRPYWLDRPAIVAPPRHSLADEPIDDTADLVVVGAGFTGLWAAIEAAQAGRSVVVLESDGIAGGASGRCGGFINASITHGIPHGHSRWPHEMSAIVALQSAMWDDTLRLLDEWGGAGIVQPVGKLTVATRPHHAASLAATVELFRSYQQDTTLLDRDELATIVRSPTYLAGYRHATANGLCDPTRLSVLLADVAERSGVRIRERTRVEAIDDEPDRVVLRCDTGSVRARRVLLATNASTPLLRRVRARMIPVYDHVIVTEPLAPEQWDEIGWAGGEATVAPGITDAGNQFHYYRPTPDGGLLFGGWDATYHFGGRIDAAYEQQSATHRLLVEHLRQTFPVLHDLAVTHAWGGPIDSTSRFTPYFGTTLDGRVGWAIGFTGLGVGSSRFAALAALDLLDERTTERTVLSMVQRAPIPFPPEPLRSLAVSATKRSLIGEDQSGRRNVWLRLLDRLGIGFDT